MLSRIFVSLLILSALTSDGTINLTEYLFGPYLYEDVGPSVVSEKKDIPSDEENKPSRNKTAKDNDKMLFNTAYCSSYIINIKDNFIYAKKKLTKLWVNSSYITHQNVCVGFHSKICFRPLFFKKDKEIVLSSSDLSPPVV